MEKRKIQKIITYCAMLFLLTGILAGCGKKQEEDGMTYFHHSLAEQRETQTEEESTNEQEMYLISAVDQTEETLQLYRYANGMEYRYYYGTGTRFYDKYGNRTTIASFRQGLLITIGEVNDEGILTEATVSDQAWVYDNIQRFSVNTELQMLKIADSKYRYDETTHVFSGDMQVSMEDIRSGDTLSVVGIGKQILSVNIVNAQGTLKLVNTELFEGSFVQVGTRYFSKITPDMQIQIPEGTYEVSVANNGWGGSTEVTIVRGETTTVDLDKIKGEGPKSGKIQFVIDVEDAILMLDGKEVDYEKPVKLTYGLHKLSVYADGFDPWERNLYVNSPKSTIVIELKDEEDETETITSDTGSQDTQEKETESESESSQQDTQSESEKRQDELDLIKDLISGMNEASSLVTN